MYDACILHLNKEGTTPQLLNNLEMIEFLERSITFYYHHNNTNCYLAKQGGFCGVVGPRLSVNRNLEKVFEEYVGQVKRSDDEHHKKEGEKHGSDYTPQTKPFQLGDEGVFDCDENKKQVKEDVFKECLGNLIRQDGRFGNFEKKILYLDCNNLYVELNIEDFKNNS